MASTKNPIHRIFGIDGAAHGDIAGIKLDPSVELQVIDVGLSRTGTTSLQAALTMLGFTPTHGVCILRQLFNEACIDISRAWISYARHSVLTISSKSTRKFCQENGKLATQHSRNAFASSCVVTARSRMYPSFRWLSRSIQYSRRRSTS